MELKKGIRGQISSVVTKERTAVAIGSGDLPVFATPSMTALMEQAAQESVTPYLEEGCSTVGTRLDIVHMAATPVGMGVRAESELKQVDGRKLVFCVRAFDETQQIGEGIHERVIVQKEKFLSRAEAKNGGGSANDENRY